MWQLLFFLKTAVTEAMCFLRRMLHLIQRHLSHRRRWHATASSAYAAGLLAVALKTKSASTHEHMVCAYCRQHACKPWRSLLSFSSSVCGEQVAPEQAINENGGNNMNQEFDKPPKV